MPSFLARRRVVVPVALVALVVVIGASSFYAWRAGGTLGAAGRRDACASVKQPADGASANWVAVSDASPQAMARLLSELPAFTLAPPGSLTPDAPLLVHPIRMRTGDDFNDCPHWLLPERDASGHLAAIMDYVYDYPHARLRFATAGIIHSGDPRYAHPFPYLSSAQAAARVKSARGIDVKLEPSPELVFLPLDIGFPEQPGPAAGWRGGGSAPMDPIWLVAGEDGQDYFVGTDLRIYSLHDLPLS